MSSRAGIRMSQFSRHFARASPFRRAPTRRYQTTEAVPASPAAPAQAAVNFFLGCVGVIQVTRILRYQQSVKAGTVAEAVEQDAKDAAQTMKGTAENPEAAAKSAIQ
ncbi:MAG: hypothetical protein LQ352_004708 [Teloschistes flavicans]|nr:MAG: hypothetical protein LQ352_004708 [Teloschistes flavicans]